MLFWRKTFVQRHLARDGSPRIEGGSSCGVSVWFEGHSSGEASHPGPATGPTRWDTSSDESVLRRVFLLCVHSYFCIPVSRSMVRKGWIQKEVPSGWVQILWGPRPPSQQWPKRSAVPSTQLLRRVPTGQASSRKLVPRVNPDSSREAAR